MILLGLPVKTVAIKEPWLFLAKAIPLVEMARVELASESISTEISPGAAYGGSFAFQYAHRQTYRKTIP